jgi:hypothetical protein
MTDKAKLESLLTALRAAPGPSRELDAEIAFAIGYFDNHLKWFPNCHIERGERLTEDGVEVHVVDKGRCIYFEPLPKFTSSRDAAAAFRERMLPGWEYHGSGRGKRGFWAFVAKDEWSGLYKERCATECLSIVAAVVAGVISVAKRDDSLIAQEGKRD